jgi:hypothetical protein
MKPTVSGISQLDAPPGLRSAQEQALHASEPRTANPRGYADLIQSAYVRTGVNKFMTRFAQVNYSPGNGLCGSGSNKAASGNGSSSMALDSGEMGCDGGGPNA